MAEYLSLEEARSRLRSPSPLSSDGFSLLRTVAHTLDPEASSAPPEVVDLVIRLLERRSELGNVRDLLDSVVRQVGLFPYLQPELLSPQDQVAYEAHRPYGMTDLVLHGVQGELYRRLIAGENVILSAPTSFGKSLIVDALVASGNYTNIAIVVPTIALIDETRRRLSRYSHLYKLVTHPSQSPRDTNIFVMTQERLLDLEAIPRIDLFIIDEFYKLDMRGDAERASLLNTALVRLWRTRAQFLMLGPNIAAVSENLPPDVRATFFHTDFKTVAADVTRVRATASEQQDRLVNLLNDLGGSTLIYCSSPNRVRQVVKWLDSANTGAGFDRFDQSLAQAADWLAAEFDPEWYVVEAVRRGIGVHHGRLPRSLGQWMVRAFNDGRLRSLVCTSTLIEGVNTRAKNVIILDNRVARSALDYFTFNNIRGRSGRMFQHFVGRVILFHEPPQPELPIVDIPALTQSDNADPSLLIQLREQELSDESRERLRDILSQELLSLETLRSNTGVDPSRQVAVARRILESRQLARDLAWIGYPTYEQLQAACVLIVEVLRQQRGRVAGVSSGRQLAFLINRLRSRRGGSLTRLLEADNPDDTIEGSLEFLRFWPGHNFPRHLMALHRIQSEVLPRLGMPRGDYSVFAAACENLFLPAPLQTLEEYGVPTQLALRISDHLQPNGDLDAVLERLRSTPASLDLHPFEKELLRDALEHL